jgi:acyl-CoA reductase-like NAD-dependent aldehyde dehydrogenase
MSTRPIIEAATQGEWRLATSKSVKVGDKTICRTHDRKWRYGNDAQETADARFVAHFSPAHIALMEDVCEAAADRHAEWTRDTYVRVDDALAALAAYRKEHGDE